MTPRRVIYPKISLRQARPKDAEVVATIAYRSRAHFLPYLPDLHSRDAFVDFYRNCVFLDCTVWLAVDHQTPVGFCAFRQGWVDHLYLLPDYVGRSLGTALLNKAKESEAYLQLWVFQQNAHAIRFYEGEGFRKVRETDGASNEEKIPDALFEWHRPQ